MNTLLRSALLLAVCSPAAFAADKATMAADLNTLADAITTAKASGAPAATLLDLQQQYADLSAQLNGWNPAGVVPGAGSLPASEAPAPVPPGATSTTTNYGPAGSISILDNQSNASTITVAGAGDEIWDVDLNTFITHTWNSDLTITLTSPAGTSVTVSSANGGSADDVFNGTTFDDQVLGPVSDEVYVDGVTASPLTPEGAFGAFRGENPNGDWTLDCADGAAGDTGAFDWSLDVTTLDVSVNTTTTSHSNLDGTLILDNQSNTSSIEVSGADEFLCDVDLTTFITHTWNSDLTITLTSPAGTTVTVSSANGGSADDVFDGTLFDDSQTATVTDEVYVDGVAAGPLAPEGAFGAFAGENPNGTWTLDCADGAAGDTGAFDWSLDLTTCEAAECFLVIGNTPGVDPFKPQLHEFDTLVGDIQEFHAVLLDDIPEFVLPSAWFPSAQVGLPGSVSLDSTPDWIGDDHTFAVQVLMWNPIDMPQDPEQWTNGLLVKVLPGGQVMARPYGQSTGMEVWCETYVNDKGQHVMTFPFSIPGF